MTTVRGPVVSTLNSGLCRLNNTLSAAAAVGSGTAKSSGFTTVRRDECIPVGWLEAIVAAVSASGLTGASGAETVGSLSDSVRAEPSSSPDAFARRDDGPWAIGEATGAPAESAVDSSHDDSLFPSVTAG